MAFTKNFEHAVYHRARAERLVKKHGYLWFEPKTFNSQSWTVFRRAAPTNIPNDEDLCRNIIHYAQRYIQVEEAEFAEDIKKKERSKPVAPAIPDSIAQMYPRARDEAKHAFKETRAPMDDESLTLERTPMSRKKKNKLRSKIKQRKRAALKSMQTYIPGKARDPNQRFVAVAWVLSPKYHKVDDTKHFGKPSPTPEEDPNPDKIYGPEDFDEAMVVRFLRGFKEADECGEFIDNKAKHDLQFARVTCIDMNENVPLDVMITRAFKAAVPRGYITKALHEAVVGREEHSRQAAQDAKANPDLVRRVVEDEDGNMKYELSKNEIRTEAAMQAEKARLVAEQEAKKAEMEAKMEAEMEGGGGGSKDDDIEVQEEVIEEVQEVQEEAVAEEVVEESIESNESE